MSAAALSSGQPGFRLLQGRHSKPAPSLPFRPTLGKAFEGLSVAILRPTSEGHDKGIAGQSEDVPTVVRDRAHQPLSTRRYVAKKRAEHI